MTLIKEGAPEFESSDSGYSTMSIVLMVLVPVAICMIIFLIIYCIFDYEKQSKRAKIIDGGWSDPSAVKSNYKMATKASAAQMDMGFNFKKNQSKDVRIINTGDSVNLTQGDA